ncbi:MAG: response regulator [Bacteroidota bacterium]
MNIKHIYILFISLLILSIAGSQLVIHRILVQQEADSIVINLSGRQRMLSQLISKHALQVVQTTEKSKKEYHQFALRDAIEEFENKFLVLQFGNQDLGIPPTKDQTTLALYDQLKPHYQSFVHQAKNLSNPGENLKESQQLEIVLRESPLVLQTLDRIVNEYEKNAKNKVSKLRRTEYILAVVTIFIVIIEVFFLISPNFKRLNKQNVELQSNQQQLLKQQEQLITQSEQIKTTNKELKESKQRAEDASIAKSRFLSNMSHEIRTPMNAIIGITNILREEDPRPDQVEYLNDLEFSADNLLIIINDILDFSKIEAGKLVIENIDFDVRKIINSVFNALKPRAIEKQLTYKYNIDNNLPTFLKGDPTRLSQILNNLLSNAIKFTSKGYVQLNVFQIYQTPKDVTILFEVIDTGVGIPEQKQDKIFDSFSQVDTKTTRLFGGTGLGLTITKQLLEMQGSSIKLRSKDQVGSTFFFEITYKIGQKPQIDGRKKSNLKNLESFKKGSKILIAEDNLLNIKLIEHLFNKWDIEFEIANNGKEAIEKINEAPYDVVIMDLNMPVMDGYEATRAIRKMEIDGEKTIPILASSASAYHEYKKKAIDSGANEFLTKPFKPIELHKILKKYL